MSGGWTNLTITPKGEEELSTVSGTRGLGWDSRGKWVLPRRPFLESLTIPSLPPDRIGLVLLTCACVWPVFGAHEAPHGGVSGVTVLPVEAIPAACRQRHQALVYSPEDPSCPSPPHLSPWNLPSRKSNHRRLPLDSFK